MIGHVGTNTRSRTNWVMASAVRTSVRPSVPGLSASDLSVFLGFGDFITATEEAMLQTFIDTSIEMLVKYTGYEPSEVDYTVSYDRHPEAVRPTGGISSVGVYSEWISLPRRPVKSINEVRTSGEITTDYEYDFESNPARVALASQSIDYSAFAEIEIDITCGPNGDVDNTFVVAVLMLASYLYNNRGCGVKNAISESGAGSMVRPLKVAIGGL